MIGQAFEPDRVPVTVFGWPRKQMAPHRQHGCQLLQNEVARFHAVVDEHVLRDDQVRIREADWPIREDVVLLEGDHVAKPGMELDGVLSPRDADIAP